MQIKFVPFIFVLFFAMYLSAKTELIRSNGSRSTEKVSVWVIFTDKNNSGGLQKVSLSKRALARRIKVGFVDNEQGDLPISESYIAQITSNGGFFRKAFKWENAASFDLPLSLIADLKNKPFVKDVLLLTSTPADDSLPNLQLYKKASGHSAYGTLADELSRLRIPQAHRYLDYLQPGSAPGEGVTIALFDNGFRLDHRCFKHLMEIKSIIASYDFVDNDNDVTVSDTHGTMVLGLIAAYDPPYYTGSAWGANFLLARTEADDYENHSEEDNWAAAIVWAEEHGTDIISSSLGYRDFDDTLIIKNDNGIADTIVNYLKRDLDGKTTIISRAAAAAAKRGILILNAMGNEQDEWGDTSLSAPADVEDVISVGGLNDKNTIAFTSSIGPTSDGRIKPDLVAPNSVSVPDIYNINSTNYSMRESGTSCSTPLVAGIVILIKQAFPLLDASQIREKLYTYCKFLPVQKKRDNIYGRGIPDAVRSCMQNENEVFLSTADAGLPPLSDAKITVDGITIAVTDSKGNALCDLHQTQNTKILISKNRGQRIISVNSTPDFVDIHPCSLLVRILGLDGKGIEGATIRSSLSNSEIHQTTDSLGYATIVDFFPQKIRVSVTHDGYHSDVFDTELSDSFSKKEMVLTTLSPGFLVYPTVVRTKTGRHLKIIYTPSVSSNTGVYGYSMSAIIRSIDGTLIWKKEVSQSNPSINLTWDSNIHGSTVAPGIYYCIVSANGKQFRQKFLIAE